MFGDFRNSISNDGKCKKTKVQQKWIAWDKNLLLTFYRAGYWVFGT
jgi:hypothetical protein